MEDIKIPSNIISRFNKIYRNKDVNTFDIIEGNMKDMYLKLVQESVEFLDYIVEHNLRVVNDERNNATGFFVKVVVTFLLRQEYKGIVISEFFNNPKYYHYLLSQEDDDLAPFSAMYMLSHADSLDLFNEFYIIINKRCQDIIDKDNCKINYFMIGGIVNRADDDSLICEITRKFLYSFLCFMHLYGLSFRFIKNMPSIDCKLYLDGYISPYIEYMNDMSIVDKNFIFYFQSNSLNIGRNVNFGWKELINSGESPYRKLELALCFLEMRKYYIHKYNEKPFKKIDVLKKQSLRFPMSFRFPFTSNDIKRLMQSVPDDLIISKYKFYKE